MRGKGRSSDFGLRGLRLPVGQKDVRTLIAGARERAAAEVNAKLTLLYCEGGRRLRVDVLRGERAGYGQQLIEALARKLTAEYGRGGASSNSATAFARRRSFPSRQFTPQRGEN
nr:DUF1016 N-terminal domain-containing protein [Paraburkholderia youngii]